MSLLGAGVSVGYANRYLVVVLVLIYKSIFGGGVSVDIHIDF